MRYVLEAVNNYDGKTGDGAAHGGKPEVRYAPYWDYSGHGAVEVYRFPGRWRPGHWTIARRILRAARLMVENDAIGYKMVRPSTAYNALAKLGWKIASIKKVRGKCDLDCSIFVPCAVNCANVPQNKHAKNQYVIPGNAWTGNIAGYLVKAGAVKVLPSTYNIHTGAGLKAGDVIVAHDFKTRTGHTGVFAGTKWRW